LPVDKPNKDSSKKAWVDVDLTELLRKLDFFTAILKTVIHRNKDSLLLGTYYGLFFYQGFIF
jgi:hypothetical protein